MMQAGLFDDSHGHRPAEVFLDFDPVHAPLTVVYPQRAGREAGAVSVLSSLGTAVLGQRTGERVGDRAEDGSPRFVIEKLLYQPEAAGDLHL